MALRLDVEVGQVINIGDSKVTIESKNGRKARLRIDSDEDVSVDPVDADATQPQNDFAGGLRRRLLTG